MFKYLKWLYVMWYLKCLLTVLKAIFVKKNIPWLRQQERQLSCSIWYWFCWHYRLKVIQEQTATEIIGHLQKGRTMRQRSDNTISDKSSNSCGLQNVKSLRSLPQAWMHTPKQHLAHKLTSNQPHTHLPSSLVWAWTGCDVSLSDLVAKPAMLKPLPLFFNQAEKV